jgi:exopolysaccharide production protein ExoY
MTAANALWTRSLDLLVSLPLAAAAVPVLSVLALGIRRVSPGPIMYMQPRRGQNDELIRVWKLRTMHLASERILSEHLATHPDAVKVYRRTAHLPHDPRIAGGVALFARRFGLDELPQLWNVIMGEMSLVGPRPIEEHLRLSLFSESERAARAVVRPGLTGLWQIRRRSPSIRSLRRYDLLYLRRRSWKLDLWVLAHTVQALHAGHGE